MGVVIPFFFAVAIRFIPAERIVNPLARVLQYAAQVPPALVSSPIAMVVARPRGESPRQGLLWA